MARVNGNAWMGNIWVLITRPGVTFASDLEQTATVLPLTRHRLSPSFSSSTFHNRGNYTRTWLRSFSNYINSKIRKELSGAERIFLVKKRRRRIVWIDPTTRMELIRSLVGGWKQPCQRNEWSWPTSKSQLPSTWKVDRWWDRVPVQGIS